MDRPFLDATEITRDRSRWVPIGRGDAVRFCRTLPVVVVHRIQSREAASWLDGDLRFFKSDGPYLYEGLRYFLYTGALHARKLIGLKLQPKPEAEELEPMEALDVSGELLNLGSPDLKKPAPPKAPAPPKLPDLPSKQDAALPDLPAKPELSIPDLPSLPSMPELSIPAPPKLPEPPQVPELPEIPSLPEIPALPGIELALLEEKKELIPIEYRLLDGLGNPMPPTPFRVTLPDGSVRTGKSDAEGFVRVPDNTLKGQARLELLDPNETNPERIAAFAPPVDPGKHPIEVQVTDAQGEPMPNAPFRIKLPDGSVREGKSDGEGFIRFPDNTQTGEMEFALTGLAKQGA
jgi:hypothetical protein